MKTFEIAIKTKDFNKIKYNYKAPNIESIVNWANKFYENKFNLKSIQFFKNKSETTPDKATQAILLFKNWNGFFSLIITEK